MTLEKFCLYREFLGKRVTFYAVMGMLAGLAIFVGDLVIALCLQRLFTAVGLLVETPNVHFLLPLQDKYTETTFLIVVGLGRLWLGSLRVAASS